MAQKNRADCGFENSSRAAATSARGPADDYLSIYLEFDGGILFLRRFFIQISNFNVMRAATAGRRNQQYACTYLYMAATAAVLN